MPPPLPHLVFSTRGRNPAGGADAVREVIAESPGVPEAVRRDFAARADLGGALLHAELAGPVYTFSPAGDDAWLFARAVSLDRYRKGAHQLLVHGVLVGREHLAAVEGNPFLLDRAGGGLAFLDEHPGAGVALAPLAWPAAATPAAAREANLGRLAELAPTVGAADSWLPAAWGALGRGERVALVDAMPRAALVEWLLLHLHPDDRPQVSFHTWYSHGRPLGYRLLVTTPEEASRVRGQLRGLRTIDTAAPPDEAERAGGLLRVLRRRGPERLRRALDEVRLTRLAARPLPPLDEADAALCLGAALDGEDELDAARRERLALLRLRSEPAAALRYAVGDLAAAWRRGVEAFDTALAALAASVEVAPEAAAAVAAALARSDGGGGGDPGGGERWALLALLDAAARRRGGSRLEAAQLAAWRRLVPGEGGFAGLVAGFDEARARRAEETLARFVLAAAAAEAAAARGDEDAAPAGAARRPDSGDGGGAGAEGGGWPAFLDWLAARGRPGGALAGEVERLALAAPAPLGRRWLRRLGDHHALAGDPDEALRVWLAGEAARLDGEPRRRRVEAVVGWALDRSAGGLDRFFARPETGETVAAAVGAWAAAQADPEAAWRRLERTLGGWRLAADAAPALGALLAGLAASPLAARLPQAVAVLVPALGTGGGAPAGRLLGAALAEAARRLAPFVAAARRPGELVAAVSGAAELLRVRGGHPGAGAADGALLALAAPALAAAQELAARGGEAAAAAERFRDAWTGLLASRAVRRHDDAAVPPGLDAAAREDWLDLLLDDFALRPLDGAEDDPRYQLLLTLAWSAWADDPSTRRRLRLVRALRLPRVPAGARWHRERVAAAVPPELAPAAHRLLRLPPSAAGDNLTREGGR